MRLLQYSVGMKNGAFLCGKPHQLATTIHYPWSRCLLVLIPKRMQVSVHDLIYIIVRCFRVMRFLLCFGSEHIQLLGHFRLAGGEHMPIHTGYIDGFVSHARGNGGERETHVDQKGDVRVPQIRMRIRFTPAAFEPRCISLVRKYLVKGKIRSSGSGL